MVVLNLVISGIPSIQKMVAKWKSYTNIVLNLVISGIPSIQKKWLINIMLLMKF